MSWLFGQFIYLHLLAVCFFPLRFLSRLVVFDNAFLLSKNGNGVVETQEYFETMHSANVISCCKGRDSKRLVLAHG